MILQTKTSKIMKKINNTLKEPKLEDFYDEQDPRGCSSSEYNEYLKALGDYNKLRKLDIKYEN